MSDDQNSIFAHELSDFWVVEWSCSQKALHVDDLALTLKRNIQKLNTDKPSDYIIVAITRTEDEAFRLAREFDPYGP